MRRSAVALAFLAASPAASAELVIDKLKAVGVNETERNLRNKISRGTFAAVGYYAYPTFAKLAIQRRANLAASVAGLESQLAGARRELHEACEELKKIQLKRIELLGERDTVGPVPDSGEVAA